MRKITLSEYNSIPKDYRGIWTVERWDLPNWAEIREKHMGKRTMMVYDKGTCLLVEGLGFEIVDDSIWKKADEVKKEIGSRNSTVSRDVNLIMRTALSGGATRWKRKK